MGEDDLDTPLTESGFHKRHTRLELEQEAIRVEAARRGRLTEDVAMWVAIVLIVIRSGVELVQEIGMVPHVDAGFPFGFWMTCGLLVLPKVVGRASAGRFWEAIGGGIGRRIGGGKDKESDG